MHFNKKKLSEICAATLIASGAATLIAPAVAIAATAAGTLIKNLATVTYEDANGNEYSAQSNEAIITVKQVYSAEIGEDTPTTAAAGQSVYIQHTLSNTGNGTDTYTLTAADDITASDTINADNVNIYLDSNGNGLADPGEPEITGDITLAAGESAEIVIEVAIPNSAAAGDTLGVILTAEAHEGNGSASALVDDTTALNGTDTAEGTVQNLITISDNAVLNYTKASVWTGAPNPAAIDPANPLTWPKYTYTLTITNTGNQAATAVSIIDGVPAGMTEISTPTASGILGSNGDTIPGFVDLDETADGIDYDNDGTVGGSVRGVTAVDASIAPGQTVSVTFEAAYDPTNFNNDSNPGSAGDTIINQAHLIADLDGSGTPNPPITSNTTDNALPQMFGTSADDTGTGTGAPTGTNDGGDDDTTLNNVQTVDTAPDGSTVDFPVVITNSGTGPDTFDLTVANGDFPPGTTFTFWNADGTVPLVDTNGEAGPDTGVLESGETLTVMVKANLPSNPALADLNNVADGGTGYTATVTSTSSEDPDITPQFDTTMILLRDIVAATVDIRDTVLTATAGTDDDALNIPGAAVDADGNNTDGYNITVGGADVYDGTEGATVGGTVNIPFHIDNNSGASDAFQLSAGSSINGTTIGPLPAGWAVDFYKADASGNPTGQPLNSTELLAPNSIGGTTTNHYVAVINIPGDPAMAPANYIADNDGDIQLEIMDANNDGDGDQPIFIRIESTNSGSSDVMVDAIDVDSIRDITLTPPGANQIQPGGSVDYSNTLENTGNTDEPLELTATNSESSDGWNNNVTVPVDDDNNPATPPVDKPLSQLQPGDIVEGTDGNGDPVGMPVSTGPNGHPQITLPAGVQVPLTPMVYAPTDAAPGTTDTLTITATSPDTNGPTTSIENVSEVIAGQVRLTKTVALDSGCDGIEPAANFATNLSTEIAPGECAVWQIVAENQGSAAAMNVVIRDEVTAFTSYAPNTLSYALGNGATPAAVTDITADDAGEISGDAVTFYVGTSPDAANATGGTLAPGEFATVRFSTMID